MKRARRKIPEIREKSVKKEQSFQEIPKLNLKTGKIRIHKRLNEARDGTNAFKVKINPFLGYKAKAKNLARV